MENTRGFRWRSAVYRICCWIMVVLMQVSLHAAHPERDRLPDRHYLWDAWKRLDGELSAWLDVEAEIVEDECKQKATAG